MLSYSRLKFLFALFLAINTVHAPLLATSFTVNTIADAVDVQPGDGICATAENVCTLRAAIQETNALGGANVVVLPQGIYQLKLPNADAHDEELSMTGDLDIDDSLTIAGESADTTIVDAGALDRVLEINSNIAVTLTGMTIRGGSIRGADGGAIVNYGYLAIRDSIIRNNSANFLTSTGGNGGGIANFGTLTVQDSTMQENSAGLGQGGSIYNTGVMTLTDTVIASNSASGWMLDNGMWEAFGGGIANTGQAALYQSTIVSNTVDVGSGGGILNAGELWIDASELIGNKALTEAGGLRNTGTVSVTDSLIAINQAGWGGGIYNNGMMIADRLRVRNNDATPFTIGFGACCSHTWPGGGGGIYNDNSGTFILTASEVSSNQAKSTFNIHGDYLEATGGGISNSGIFTVTTSTISANLVEGDGAGVANTASGTLLLSGSTVAWNAIAATDMPTIPGDGGISNGGTIRLLNTILARNTHWDGTASDCGGVAVISLGYNLIQSMANCTISGAIIGNVIGRDPQLGPLQDNGGSTRTHALYQRSPAIDAGINMGCAPVDQRDVSRPIDGDKDGTLTCDIGAYEAPRPEYFYTYLPFSRH